MRLKPTFIIGLLLLFTPVMLWGQSTAATGKSEVHLMSNEQKVKVKFEDVESQELLDFWGFEKIQYKKISFTSKYLKNKTYQLSVKEIWDGKITKDSTLLNSKTFLDGMAPDYLKIVGDTVLKMRIISKLTDEHKLKMEFLFPRYTITSEFNATPSNDYSLRPAINTEIVDFGKNFQILVYMLPYENGDKKYYCAVEASGKKIETWGNEFGIKHYLIFEMKFEQ